MEQIPSKIHWKSPYLGKAEAADEARITKINVENMLLAELLPSWSLSLDCQAQPLKRKDIQSDNFILTRYL